MQKAVTLRKNPRVWLGAQGGQQQRRVPPGRQRHGQGRQSRRGARLGSAVARALRRRRAALDARPFSAPRRRAATRLPPALPTGQGARGRGIGIGDRGSGSDRGRRAPASSGGPAVAARAPLCSVVWQARFAVWPRRGGAVRGGMRWAAARVRAVPGRCAARGVRASDAVPAASSLIHVRLLLGPLAAVAAWAQTHRSMRCRPRPPPRAGRSCTSRNTRNSR